MASWSLGLLLALLPGRSGAQPAASAESGRLAAGPGRAPSGAGAEAGTHPDPSKKARLRLTPSAQPVDDSLPPSPLGATSGAGGTADPASVAASPAPAPLPTPDDAPRAYRTTVSARRFLPDEGTAFPQQVLGREARDLPLIDNDLYRSLHLIPGVQADDFTARFSLRGGESSDLATLIDGVPLYDPFHLQDYGGAISALGLDAVQSTTLLADGFPARYGDRLGGVVLVRTREPDQDGHHGSAGVDLLNAHALASGPLGARGGYLVSARRGYIDLFLDAAFPELGFRPAYWDAFVKLTQRVGEHDRLAAYGLWAADSNAVLRDAPEPDLHSTYGNGAAWLRWERRLGSGGGRTVAALAYGHASRDRQEGTQGWDLRTTDHLLVQQEWSLPLGATVAGRAGELTWGGRLRWARGDYDYRVSELVDLDHPELRQLEVQARAQGLQTSLFVEHGARPWPWLQTTVGVRVDRQQGVDEWNPGPRLAVALLPHPTLTLRAAWGLYAAPVTPEELPVEVGRGQLQPAEQAEHRVLGALWRPGHGLQLRLEAYWRELDRLVGLLPDLGREERVFTLPDAARAQGLELEVRGTLAGPRLGWLAGYSLSRAIQWRHGEPAHPRPDDRTHAATGGLDWDAGRAGHLSLVVRFHSGVPYTPAVGVTSDPQAERGLRIDYGPPNSARLPAFFSLDGRWTRQWRFASWTLQGYAQLLNATLHDNVHEYVHDLAVTPGGPTVVRRQEGYFPILPAVGVEGRW